LRSLFIMEIKQTDLALLKVLHDNTTSNFPGLIKDFRKITRAVERLNYSLFEAKYQQQEWEQHREVLVVKFAGLNYSLLQLLKLGISGSLAKVLIILAMLGLLIFAARVFICYMTRD